MNYEEIITQARLWAIKGGLVSVAAIAAAAAGMFVFSIIRIVMHWCELLMVSQGISAEAASNAMAFIWFMFFVAIVVAVFSVVHFAEKRGARREDD